jgi:hypothetical protein
MTAAGHRARGGPKVARRLRAKPTGDGATGPEIGWFASLTEAEQAIFVDECVRYVERKVPLG